MITDKKQLFLLHILTKMLAGAFIFELNLWVVIVFKLVEITLKHGRSIYTPSIFMQYGIILCKAKKYQKAYEYGKLAYNLVKDEENAFGRIKIYQSGHAFLTHLKEPLHITLPDLMEGYKRGIELGDKEYGFYCTPIYTIFGIICGKNLQKLYKEATEMRTVAYSYNELSSFTFTSIISQSMLSLMYSNQTPYILEGNDYKESEKLAIHQSSKDTFALSTLYTLKIMLAFTFGNYDICKKYGEEFIDVVQIYDGLYYCNFCEFYVLLALLKTKNEHSVLFKSLYKKFKLYARESPDNNLHKLYLIDAELYRSRKQFSKAQWHYELALEKVTKTEFINDKALILELLASYKFTTTNSGMGLYYLKESIKLYKHWGAGAKVNQLKSNYNHLKLDDEKKDLAELFKIRQSQKSTQTSIKNLIDLETILRASQALSNEVILDKLIEKLMNILMLNAGAEKEALLLNINDRWELKSYIHQKKMHQILDGIYLEQLAYTKNEIKLPKRIIQLVIRTKKPLLIEDASTNERFMTDQYVTDHHAKSIFCLPLLNQGKLNGVLYLENNLTIGAFTSNHESILNILSSQMAISIENALIYEKLEGMVTDRTQELQTVNSLLKEKNKEIEIKNKNITDSILYAKQIQKASLPSPQKFGKTFAQQFVIYQPKDIVSGDFYWYTIKNDYIILAVADCTGHGVPGALMSMLGQASLNQIINSEQIINPIDILNRLNQEIRAALKYDESNMYDGMDIGICVINKKVSQIQYSGAKISLVSYKDGQLDVYDGDRVSIGGGLLGFNDAKEFNIHTISYNKNDRFYMATDGVRDQFGQNNMKKYLAKRYYACIQKYGHLHLAQQGKKIKSELDQWKGQTDQVDDILVIGFNI